MNRNETDNDHYQAYGKFAVKFEWVCDSLRRSMGSILASQGLTNQQISQSLFADMTAEPLRSMYKTIVSDTYQLDAENKKILDNLMKRFQNLISCRNNIIHGFWFMGVESSDGQNVLAEGFKPHRTEKGSVAKQFKMSAKDFNDLAHESEELAFMFWRATAILCCNRELKNNFSIDENGNVFVSSL